MERMEYTWLQTSWVYLLLNRPPGNKDKEMEVHIMLNRIILSGRLTRDPELRHTQSGIPVASFSLAVNRDFKDKATGETPVDFIDIVAWRHTGEFAANYFAKGSMAVVEGRLQVRDWTDREGGKRRTTEVVASNIYFGDSTKKKSAPAPASDARAVPPTSEFEDDADGELPF